MKLRASLIFAILLVSPAAMIWPATFLVDSPADRHDVMPGDGIAADHLDPDSAGSTLRAAIEEANAWPGPDTVVVSAAIGPYRLSLGVLRLLDDATMIEGIDGYAVVDGIANVINHATLSLESDSNVVTGLHLRRARGDAIRITGAHNRLGYYTAIDRLILTDNGLDNPNAAAIRISGTEAIGNSVLGCYIGLEAGGLTPAGNRHGVILEADASDNQIGSSIGKGRNFISGNSGYGVIVANSCFGNRIVCNSIGPDSTNSSGPGNQLGGILVRDYAHDNRIGADSIPVGNLVSGNRGAGIELAGPGVTGNAIDGNLIGCDLSGYYSLGNFGDGLSLRSGAHDNVIGGPEVYSGNLVSGNAGNGIVLRGEDVSGNRLTANWVGPTRSGYGYLSNGWIEGDGIRIDSGAHDNRIGGTSEAERNVISANYGAGVRMDGLGTTGNRLSGCFVGLNATGSSSLGNAAGVIISGGAHGNTVGGIDSSYTNVISSNRGENFPYGAGALIVGEGTDYNTISANIIGLDVTGMKPRPNGHTGILIMDGASYNLIGGDNLADGNYISGNGIYDPIEGRAAGIHISGPTTSHNRVSGNVIGLAVEGTDVPGNAGHGVGIFAGASHNRIGGDSFWQHNRIVGSEGAGVFISGPTTVSNLIRHNLIRDNDGLGIDLRDSAQNGIEPPRITRVGQLINFGPRFVSGADAPPDSRVDIYRATESIDPSGSGEGATLVGFTYSDGHGNFETYLPPGPPGPIVLTAVVTDSDNNSSEFSLNGYSPDATPVETDDTELPREFDLAQNYPNPFNAATAISFYLPRAGKVRLTVFNVLGREVIRLADDLYSVGEHKVSWDGRDTQGRSLASGVYLYRLDFGDTHFVRKIILLK